MSDEDQDSYISRALLRAAAIALCALIAAICLIILLAARADAYCYTQDYSLQDGEKVCTVCCREPMDSRDMERGPTGRDMPRWRASRNCNVRCKYTPRAYTRDNYEDEERDR